MPNPWKYVIAAGVILAAVGGFYWRAYHEGEKHAQQKQEQYDKAARERADGVRNRDIGVDPSQLLKDDPWLRK